MTGQGFSTHFRLHHGREFDAVFKNNKLRVQNRSFLFLAMQNELENSRLGLVVGKKTSKRAVDRNQIKRLVREMFRTRVATLRAPIDLVVVSRPGAMQITRIELTSNLGQLWTLLEQKLERYGES